MRKTLFIALASALAVSAVATADTKLPDDVLVNPDFDVRTAWPYPKANSGEIEWRPHGRDLTQWITLSYEDKRGIPEPATVRFNGNVKGNVERGREIATHVRKGNCVACHAIPGAAQTGTAGPSLEGYSTRGVPDSYVYQMLHDPRALFPETVMPAFGAMNNLTEQEIHDVMAFLKTL
ncbi:sulfur oxidation c-type cytochrome SoxX [Thioalkalivibrio denitrificans]|uniref:Sulfur oxidation c-type cytochrome SoxX n=1 Tax=Thioalkalivibrio denitrificans TaxID=108003 RepID=A0A1V3NA01_9GAMM|nr:sulfur oxidation c-type cytochrome SoxX [Thioalkalivibrio denitrificans]OOG21793.1 sulfur oxidation c-type cytochrome SoxX [Thioalkalivibrio denitrificans]